MNNEEKLREEFYSKIAEFSDGNNHVEAYSMQKIADFFLTHHRQALEEARSSWKLIAEGEYERGQDELRATLENKVEGLKKDKGYFSLENLNANGRVKKDTRDAMIYNQALDDVLAIIREEI